MVGIADLMDLLTMRETCLSRGRLLRQLPIAPGNRLADPSRNICSWYPIDHNSSRAQDIPGHQTTT
jgi:hypothetical protein